MIWKYWSKIAFLKAEISPEIVEDMYPVTPIQKGILLSRQKGMASYANFWVWHCVPLTCAESVSPTRLLEAWREVARRHTILATTVVENPERNGFVQVLLRDPKTKVEHISDASGKVGGRLLDMKRPSFRPGRPEHAFTVCAASDGQVYCRLDISHVLMDARSMLVLLDDLTQAYSGITLSPAPPFRHLVQDVGNKDQTESLRYWSEYLQAVQTCEFPVDDLSSEDSSRGHITLPSSTTSGIDKFCRDEGIRRSVFFQIAWAFVFSQCTGMSEVCFACLVSSRDAPIDDIEHMVGPLINMLVTRIDLSRTLEEIATAVSEHSIKQLEFRHTSLTDISNDTMVDGKRVFNTAINVRQTTMEKSADVGKIRFEEVGADDPHKVGSLPSRFLDVITLTYISLT